MGKRQDAWIEENSLTIRDRLALACPGLSNALGREFEMPTLGQVCRYRYEWADAMLEARSPGRDEEEG